MPRLTGDRGAVAVITAILMSTVLLGMTALVVDVGSLYAERRQLQAGADAAAIAVAEDCGSVRICTSGSGQSPAQTAAALANSNANDATANVDLVCGTAPGVPACPAPQGEWDCPALPAGALSTASYVQVETSTRTESGSTLLPPSFARAMPGLASYDGTNVKACARASYGPPVNLTSVLPLTFSKCEWDRFTSNGTVFAPAGPYPNPTPWPAEVNIYFHTSTQAPHCGDAPSGADLPGGFGWLSVSSGCQISTGVDGWYNDSTGRAAPNGCDTTLASLVGKVIDVPVYDNTNGLTGNNGQYEIANYAPFFITGYYVNGGDSVASVITGQAKCASGSASDSCIKGFFTKDLVPTTGTIGTGPSYGSVVVQMSG